MYFYFVKFCTLFLFFQARGIKLENDDDLVGPITDGCLDIKVSMDNTGVLCWPVVFVYPEFGETDLISSFNENDRYLYSRILETTLYSVFPNFVFWAKVELWI